MQVQKLTVQVKNFSVEVKKSTVHLFAQVKHVIGQVKHSIIPCTCAPGWGLLPVQKLMVQVQKLTVQVKNSVLKSKIILFNWLVKLKMSVGPLTIWKLECASSKIDCSS